MWCSVGHSAVFCRVVCGVVCGAVSGVYRVNTYPCYSKQLRASPPACYKDHCLGPPSESAGTPWDINRNHPLCSLLSRGPRLESINNARRERPESHFSKTHKYYKKAIVHKIG